jgi:hypothetical protein
MHGLGLVAGWYSAIVKKWRLISLRPMNMHATRTISIQYTDVTRFFSVSLISCVAIFVWSSMFTFYKVDSVWWSREVNCCIVVQHRAVSTCASRLDEDNHLHDLKLAGHPYSSSLDLVGQIFQWQSTMKLRAWTNECTSFQSMGHTKSGRVGSFSHCTTAWSIHTRVADKKYGLIRSL